MGKPAPKFWWDHDMNGDIIVQGDYAGGECLVRFPRIPGQDDQSTLVQMAAQMVSDFESGRKTPKWGIRA